MTQDNEPSREVRKEEERREKVDRKAARMERRALLATGEGLTADEQAKVAMQTNKRMQKRAAKMTERKIATPPGWKPREA